MKKPFVSVILPVYNGERFVADAVDSILCQDYHPLEIIAVDDGSTDDTAQILQSYKELRYVYQPNQGDASARNKGIADSRGEFIAFLDADDIWACNKLKVQIDCLLSNSAIVYTLGRQHNFLEPGTDRPFWVREEHLLKDHIGYLPTLVTHRTIFDRVGVFNTDYITGSDVDWFARVKDAGISMAVVPEIVLFRRIHDSNLSYRTRVGDPMLFSALRASVRRKLSEGPY
jgi:glycosyltransferase involved in cell wall biosynthesis